MFHELFFLFHTKNAETLCQILIEGLSLHKNQTF